MGSASGGFDCLDGGDDFGLAGQIVAGQIVQGGVESGEGFALVGGEHWSGAVDAVTIPRRRGTLQGRTVHVAIRHTPSIPKKFRTPF